MSTTIDSLSIEIQTNSSKAGAGIDALAASLERLKKVGSFNVVIKNLNNLSSALGKLQGSSSGLAKLNSLASSIESLKKSGSFGSLRKGLESINNKANQASGGFSVFGGKVNTTTLNLKNMISVAKSVWSALQPIVNLFKNTMGDAIEWEGIAQRFGRGFGDQANDVYSWIQELNQEMGINVQQFMQYSSTYATMLKGFGVASKDASKMALGYMELTYDVWSGYNDIYKSLDDAATAVRSAIAGEVEPVRKAGFTIIESTLEQTAANHGLKISLENATEAQKSYLRYLALVDQAKAQDLVGNYAREMNTAEGAMRTFNQQLKSLGQTFGSIFLPVLVKVMPWFQAFIDLVGDAIMAVANFFNVDIQKVDFSGSNFKGASEEIKETEQSLKDLKNATTGIDELNIISPKSDSASGSGSGSGSNNDWDVDSLWDKSIFDSIQFEVDAIKEQLKEALSGIEAMIGGFSLALGSILVLSGNPKTIALGIGLLAVGAVGLGHSIAANWGGMSEQLAETLTTITGAVSGFLLALGAILTFTGAATGLGIGLMIAGAVSLGTASSINWKFMEGDLKNEISILTGIVGGGLLAVGAIIALTGGSIGLGIALMAAGAISLVTAVSLNWDSMSEPMRKTIGTLSGIVGGGLLALGGIIAFTGVNIPLGIGLMAAGAVSLASAVALNWSSMNGSVKNTLATIGTIVGGALLGVGAVLAFTGAATGIGIAMIAAGAVGIIAAAPINWKSVTNKIKDVLKAIGIAVGASLLAIGVLLCLTGVGIPLGIGLIVAGVSSMVAGVALNWNTFKDIGKRCVEGIVSGFSSLGAKIKGLFQKLKLPTLKVTYETSGLGTIKKAVVKALGLQGWPKISFAANGGIFDMGSLVWAGEAGPEIVANAGGGKTGVMNVHQMSEAVYEGVYSAVVAAMRAGSGNSGGQAVNVYLDGKQITSSVEQRQKERGASLMGSQVYAY